MKPINILYLYPNVYFERKMSVGRVLYGQAVSALPNVTLKFWGPDWDGYDNNKPLSDNLQRTSFRPDFIWGYKLDTIHGVADVQIPKVLVFNEAHHIKTAQEIYDADASIVVFHHSNDLKHWHYLKSQGVVLRTIPHCASSRLFSRHPEDKRKNVALLSGVVSREIYPLRFRIRQVAGQIPAIVRCHPGYRLNGRNALLAQYADYADQLKNSTVSLCCTSKHKYCLAKLIESAMAGCLVASDMPDESIFQHTIGSHMSVLDKDMSDVEIVKEIKWWLEHQSERASTASDSHDWAKREFSLTRWAERFVDILRTA